MDNPKLHIATCLTPQEIEFKQLTENNAQELRILVAQEQRGAYCPNLYKAQQSLKSFLNAENMHWLFTMNTETNQFVGKIANKNDGYNKLISIFNYEAPYKYIENFSMKCFELLEENRYIANTYGSCKPYQDRIITPLHYLLAKYADELLSPDENIITFCKTILYLGANPNACDDVGNTPLHHASTAKQVRLLCDYGAKLNKRGEGGRTPLLNSIRLRNWKVAKCLLEYGANPRKKDDNGNSPLYKAIKQKSCSSFIQLLLDKGADCTIRNRKGKTIVDIADETKVDMIKNHVLSILTHNVDERTLNRYLEFYKLKLQK